MKIVHVRQSGKNRPPCEAAVRMPASPTRESQHREARQRRRGLPVGQCSLPSFYVVDGVPMCCNHAGQVAVGYLIDRE